jgi:Flp pilus assembly pilin Flp
MKMMQFLKSHWFGPWLVAALCVLVLTSAVPQKAEATTVEYAVMLALIIYVCITNVSPQGINSEAWGAIGGQLQKAGDDAALANSEGDRAREISRLSKAGGLAEALMGMTSSCADCSELRNNLQQIIGLAAALKSEALGVTSACNPDGVIGGGEQCDPLATPTGCEVLTVVTFCSAECQCEPISP